MADVVSLIDDDDEDDYEMDLELAIAASLAPPASSALRNTGSSCDGQSDGAIPTIAPDDDVQLQQALALSLETYQSEQQQQQQNMQLAGDDVFLQSRKRSCSGGAGSDSRDVSNTADAAGAGLGGQQGSSKPQPTTRAAASGSVRPGGARAPRGSSPDHSSSSDASVGRLHYLGQSVWVNSPGYAACFSGRVIAVDPGPNCSSAGPTYTVEVTGAAVKYVEASAGQLQPRLGPGDWVGPNSRGPRRSPSPPLRVWAALFPLLLLPLALNHHTGDLTQLREPWGWGARGKGHQGGGTWVAVTVILRRLGTAAMLGSLPGSVVDRNQREFGSKGAGIIQPQAAPGMLQEGPGTTLPVYPISQQHAPAQSGLPVTTTHVIYGSKASHSSKSGRPVLRNILIRSPLT
eukprot:gene10299-10458_t